MCTLAVVRRPDARHPVLVAANRDEAVDRPATGPLLWDDPVRFVAGRDERAGGTWLGVNEHGLVVGVTNHWTGSAPDPTLASRGGVVRACLQARDTTELARRLASVDPAATNPYLLLAADRDGSAFWAASVEGLVPEWIEAEAFALANRLPLSDDGARAATLGDGLADELRTEDDPDGLRARLAARLGRHDGDRGPEASVCVHTDRGFGTVSSTIVLLGTDPGDDRLWSAPGPPCTTDYVDHGDRLRALHGRS